MRDGKVLKLGVIVAIGAAVAFVVKQLRGDPAPQFSNHPTVTGGPAADPLRQPAPAAKLAPVDPTRPDPHPEPGLVPAPVDPTVAEPASAAERDDVDQTWVEPVDGACPDGYPIKAKVKSGIFHQPGGLAYERTNPDRCYPDADTATADGLRAAKR